jgi:hypothetical protein
MRIIRLKKKPKLDYLEKYTLHCLLLGHYALMTPYSIEYIVHTHKYSAPTNYDVIVLTFIICFTQPLNHERCTLPF